MLYRVHKEQVLIVIVVTPLACGYPLQVMAAYGWDERTFCIEQLNATFRSRLAASARQRHAAVRQTATLERVAYLVGTVYNFCAYHRNLACESLLKSARVLG